MTTVKCQNTTNHCKSLFAHRVVLSADVTRAIYFTFHSFATHSIWLRQRVVHCHCPAVTTKTTKFIWSLFKIDVNNVTVDRRTNLSYFVFSCSNSHIESNRWTVDIAGALWFAQRLSRFIFYDFRKFVRCTTMYSHFRFDDITRNENDNDIFSSIRLHNFCESICTRCQSDFSRRFCIVVCAGEWNRKIAIK